MPRTWCDLCRLSSFEPDACPICHQRYPTADTRIIHARGSTGIVRQRWGSPVGVAEHATGHLIYHFAASPNEVSEPSLARWANDLTIAANTLPMFSSLCRIRSWRILSARVFRSLDEPYFPRKPPLASYELRQEGGAGDPAARAAARREERIRRDLHVGRWPDDLR